MIEQLNSIASWWWTWTVAMFWQVGVLIVLIAGIDRLTRRWTWPQLRYALWSLVLIKLILPPTLSLPSGIAPKLTPFASQALTATIDESPAGSATPASLSLVESMSLTTYPVAEGRVGPADAQTTPSVQSSMSGTLHDTEPAGAQVIEPAGPVLDWRVYALGFWLLGGGTLAIFLTLRLRGLGKADRSASRTTSLPASFYNRLSGCAGRLGLRRMPRVVATDSVTCPAVFGVFRPVLLVPRGYLEQLSRRDTEHMLLHELAHVKRGDLLAHSLYMLLQIAYWYNPLLWLVRRQVHHLRELCCDATVANLLREKTGAYRQTLLETARRFLATRTEPGLGLLGLFEDSNRLLVRLSWLEKPTWRHKNMKRAIVIAIVGVMLACVLPMAHSQTTSITENSDAAAVETIGLAPPENADLFGQPERVVASTATLAMAPVQPRAQSTDQVAAEMVRLKQQMEQLEQQREQLHQLMQQLDAQMTQLNQQRIRFSEDEASGRIFQTWTVRPGDTLMSIARRFSDPNGPSLEQMVAAITERNHLEPDQLRTGQQLSIPLMPQVEAQIRIQQAQAQQQLAASSQALAANGVELAQAEQALVEARRRYAETTGRTRAGGGPGDVSPVGSSAATGAADLGRVVEVTLPERMSVTNLLDLVGSVTDQTFLYDPDVVSGSVALRLQGTLGGSLTVGQLYQLLESALEVKNLTMSRRGDNVMVIVPEESVPVATLLDVTEVENAPALALTAEAAVDADYVVKSVQRGTDVRIANNIGSMTIRRGPSRDCSINVNVEVKGATPAEAAEIARDVLVKVTPISGRLDVGVQMPDGISKAQRESIQVHFDMTMPLDCSLTATQKIGDIHLIGPGDDESRTRVQTDVGNIRVDSLQWFASLQANVGDITVVLPPNPSTRILATAQVGSIESDLPLEITSAAVVRPGQAQSALGSSANGVLGDERSREGMLDLRRSLELKTNVGSIHIWSASAAEAAGS